MKLNKIIAIAIFSVALAKGYSQTAAVKDYPVKDRANSYKAIRLNVDLSKLSEDEKKALVYLLKAAKKADEIFWLQTGADKDALLKKCEDPDLKKLIELNYGPWDRLNNEIPFVEGVGTKPAGAAFYPVDATKAEIDSLPAHVKNNQYSVVYRNADGKLEQRNYSEQYHDQIMEISANLRKAAEIYLKIFPPMHAYLTRRAMSLENNMYQESDAIWLTIKGSNLDIIIGPIENYEDKLLGSRTAFESYVLIRDKGWDAKLAKYVDMLPELQKNLPVDAKYITELPNNSNSQLAVFDALYYAGDCNAGSKTIAVNLPNDEDLQKNMGTRRTQIRNVMQAKFDNMVTPISKVVIDKSQQQYVNFEAFFNNVMFHEVAHGLGIKNLIVDNNKTVREALGATYSAIEECKADVLGLWMVTQLVEKKELPGKLDEYYVTFVASVFRSVRFGASSAHGKANMITFNTLLAAGAIERSKAGVYKVNVEKMKAAITKLAGDLLVLQGDGNLANVEAMLTNLGKIGEDLNNDLKKIASANIPVDIYFEQGLDVLGLKE